MEYPEKFDVIVIGGGHAGCEAAYASANIGAKTLLLTQQIETIGQMSCNPAIGGLGKSQLVAEVDALGGLMGIAADMSGIQYRTLNASKGPAVRATRAQADKYVYRENVRALLEKTPNIHLFQQEVADLIVEQNTVKGVITKSRLRFLSHAVVLTAGTFLGGVIHIGAEQFPAGRAGDAASNALSEQFRAREFSVGRLKTGTPARIDSKSIDYRALKAQHGDTPRPHFSFLTQAPNTLNQQACYITYTNKKTLKIIRDNLHQSAMYSGAISSVGPRYCPSIEDKVERFSNRENHQIFIEPEGGAVTEVYPNGISTSLPFNVQYDFIRSIEGFENAHITRPGYAIEYDFFDPRGLQPWLETQKMHNLFFAGQINGTTGYEEAAAQGLVAGINAARRAQGESPWYLQREQGYIGVMIDDLINTGLIEPYRMFTSRAEYRLSLRQDNADRRLTHIGYGLGTVDQTRWDAYQEKKANIAALEDTAKHTRFSRASLLQYEHYGFGGMDLRKDAYTLWELLKRPEASSEMINTLLNTAYADTVTTAVEVEAKYEGYITRQQQDIQKQAKMAAQIIPADFIYADVDSLSTEARQALERVRPVSIAQAARIPGITPATISLLLVALKKYASTRTTA